MSRSLSMKLRDVRRRVLDEGVPHYVVAVDGRIHCRCSDWTTANEEARLMAYGRPGSCYIAQERYQLGGLVALKRARSWSSYGVQSMEEYAS